jgi:hypothetical protein
MASAFIKFDSFVEALAEKQHNLGSDQLEIALSAIAPSSANTQLSNITQISYTDISARTITTTSSSQAAGVYRLVLQDLVLYATGAVPGFRYIILFNQTSVNDLLIGYYDYGSVVALNNGETFTIDFDGTNGALSFA